MGRVASDTELLRIKQIGAIDDGLVLRRMPAEEASIACRRSRAVNCQTASAARTIPWTTAAIEHMKSRESVRKKKSKCEQNLTR